MRGLWQTAKAKAFKMAQLAQSASVLLYFHQIHFNEYNAKKYTLFSCRFCKFFFHLSANGYENFNLIISPFNWSFFSPFDSPNSTSSTFFLGCSIRFCSHRPTFFLLTNIIIFFSIILCLLSHAHISTTLYMLLHLSSTHFYIFIIEQLKNIEISTS